MSSIFVVVAYNLRRRQADSRQVGKMVVVVENYFIFLLLVQLALSLTKNKGSLPFFPHFLVR